MASCHHCGAEYQAGARFCSQCGRLVESAPVEPTVSETAPTADLFLPEPAPPAAVPPAPTAVPPEPTAVPPEPTATPPEPPAATVPPEPASAVPPEPASAMPPAGPLPDATPPVVGPPGGADRGAAPTIAGAPSSWAVGDWPLVGLAALLVSAGVAAISALYGVILALAATGQASAVAPGAGIGYYLSFAWFGIAVEASTTSVSRILAFESRFLPLVGVVLPAALTWAVLRYCHPRLRAPEGLAVFVAKLTLAIGVLVAVLARVTSSGQSGEAASGGLVADVAVGPATLFAIAVVGLTGAAFLRRQGVARRTGLPLAQHHPASPAVGAALAGARAWALMAGFLTVMVLAAGVVGADSGTERVLLLLAAPLLALNLGIQAVSVALGGSVDLVAAGPAEVGGVDPVSAGHVSLFHLGFPPPPDAGAAPAVLFLVLALAPCLVAWSVWRHLRERPPAEEQDALAAGFCAALGFSVAALAGAVASQIWLAAQASDLARPGGVLVSRPAAGGTFGLALLWGLIGGLGAALVRSRRRPAPAAPTGAPATAPTATPATEPTGAPGPQPTGPPDGPAPGVA